MIELEQVSRFFGKFKAVDGISLSVPKGQTLGFLGPNGAGKTTTVRMIAGCLQQSAGRVRVCGIDTLENPKEAKRRIGYMPETQPSFSAMNVFEYLTFTAQAKGLRGNDCRNAVESVLPQADLSDLAYKNADVLSKGQKRRVSLAAALLGNPDVLLLDELTEGLDPNQKRRIYDLIASLKSDKAIIISTHILDEIDTLCDRAVIIDKGKIVLDDVPRAFAALSEKHRDVCVLIPEYHLEKAQIVFDALPQLSVRAVKSDKNGSKLFCLRPETEENAVADIVEALSGQHIKIEDIYVEKGRLEDVFYAFTTHAGGEKKP